MKTNLLQFFPSVYNCDCNLIFAFAHCYRNLWSKCCWVRNEIHCGNKDSLTIEILFRIRNNETSFFIQKSHEDFSEWTKRTFQTKCETNATYISLNKLSMSLMSLNKLFADNMSDAELISISGKLMQLMLTNRKFLGVLVVLWQNFHQFSVFWTTYYGHTHSVIVYLTHVQRHTIKKRFRIS